MGLSASNTVMLAVSDRERLSWSGRVPLVDDTCGRLTVLLTTPTQLVMATENGQVLCSQLLPTPAAAEAEEPEQQQEGLGCSSAEAPTTAAAGAGEAGAVVHVVEPHSSGSRFISLDL